MNKKKASIPKIEIIYASDGEIHDDDDSKSSGFDDKDIFKKISIEKRRRFSLFKINVQPSNRKKSSTSSIWQTRRILDVQTNIVWFCVCVCVCVFTASRAVFYYIQVTFCIFKNLFFYFLNLQQINNFSSFIFIFFINFISSFFFEKKNYVNLFVNFLTFLSSFISY